MLEKYYIKPQTIDRIRGHWLADGLQPGSTIHGRVPRDFWKSDVLDLVQRQIVQPPEHTVCMKCA